MNSKRFAATVIAAFITAGTLLLSTGCSDKEAVADTEVQIPVTAEIVKTADIEETVRTKGTLYALEEVLVSPKIPGKLDRLLVDEGTPVRIGQPVAELEKTQITLALKQAEQALAQGYAGKAQANAAVIQAEANNDQIQSDYVRMERLYKKDSIAKQQYDHALSAKRMAEASLNQAHQQLLQAEAQVEAAKIAVELAQSNLDDCTVVSPINGVVTSKMKNLGEFVNPGQAIFQIESVDQLELKAEVSSIYLARLETGMTVRATVEGFSDSLVLTIDEISPRVDLKNRSVEITSKIDNRNRRLSPGLYAGIELILETRKDVLTISRESLLSADGSHWVYRLNGKSVEKVEVSIGLSRNNRVEILSGLSPNDSIVTVGHNNLENGSVIMLTNEEK